MDAFNFSTLVRILFFKVDNRKNFSPLVKLVAYTIEHNIHMYISFQIVPINYQGLSPLTEKLLQTVHF